MLDTMMPFGESSHSLANFPDCNVMTLSGVLNEFAHPRKSDSTYEPIVEFDPFITCLDNHDNNVPDAATHMTSTHLELQQSHYQTIQRYEGINDSIDWGSDCESGESGEEIDDDVDVDEDDEVFELHSNDVTLDDSPDRLLNFAKIVTNNVKAIMSRNEGNDDYCDVFEDKFKSTLSGRALYYADLLAAANPNSTEVRKGRQNQNGGGKMATTTVTKTGSSPSLAQPVVVSDVSSTRAITICYDATGEVETGEVSIATGKRNEKVGLGPLERLFRISNAIQPETGTPFCDNGPNLKRPLLQCDYIDNVNSPGEHVVKQLRMDEGLFYGFEMEPSTSITSYQDILKKSSMSEYWQSHHLQPSCSSNSASTSFIRTPDFSYISAEWETT